MPKSKVRHKKGLLVILSAPSGCGKTTIVEWILKRHSDWLRSISATTRKPRTDEKDGVNYFFVSREAFQECVDKGEMLECAEIYGNFYGTPKKFVEEKVGEGKIVILTIDVQGTKQVLSRLGKTDSFLSVFILPPSIKVLRERLVGRNTETTEEIERRVSVAQDEIKAAKMYQRTVLNQNLEQAVQEVEESILNALKLKES